MPTRHEDALRLPSSISGGIVKPYADFQRSFCLLVVRSTVQFQSSGSPHSAKAARLSRTAQEELSPASAESKRADYSSHRSSMSVFRLHQRLLSQRKFAVGTASRTDWRLMFSGWTQW